MNKVYLSGPMRGYPEYNFPAFKAMAQMLRDYHHEVFSPAERDIAKYGYPTEDNKKYLEFSIRDAFKADTDWICTEATAMFMMKGWEKSLGAQAEWALAKALGLDIWYE